MWPIDIETSSFACRQVDEFAVLELLEGAKELLTTAGANQEFRNFFTTIAETPDIRGLAVVYTAQFRGGEELREYLEASLEKSSPQIDSGPFIAYRTALIRSLEFLKTFPMPVVVGLDGDSAADSFGVSMAVDMRVATDRAQIIHPNIGQGLPPSPSFAYFLVHALGFPKAIELLLTKTTLTSQEAFELGLVSKVVPPEALESTCLDTLRQLSALSGPSIVETRRMLQPDGDEVRQFMQTGFESLQRCAHGLKA